MTIFIYFFDKATLPINSTQHAGDQHKAT